MKIMWYVYKYGKGFPCVDDWYSEEFVFEVEEEIDYGDNFRDPEFCLEVLGLCKKISLAPYAQVNFENFFVSNTISLFFDTDDGNPEIAYKSFKKTILEEGLLDSLTKKDLDQIYEENKF